MTAKAWTKEELARAIALRLEGHKWAEVAAMIHRSESALWVKLGKLQIKIRPTGADEQAVRENLVRLHEKLIAEAEREAGAPDAARAEEQQDSSTTTRTLADTSIEEDVEEARRRIAMAEARESKKKYLEVLADRALEDRLVDIFRERIQPFTAPSAPPPPQFWPVPKVGRQPESAVLLISDTHIGQVVSTSQTNGFGYYNPRIFAERLHYIQDQVIEIIGQCSTGVDELHVMLLGDIVHGGLNHGAEREDNCLIADQFQLAVWCLHQFLASLAFRLPTLRVTTVVGNHGRWPGQHKMPSKNRYSNLDYLVYSSLQLSLQAQGLTNISMELNDAPKQLIEIKGSRFLAAHGDHLRGGDRQFGVPIHSMTRDVNAVGQRYAAADEPGIDYFLVGDKHRSMSLPLARGEYIVNGSLVGVDEFAMSFAPGEAMQLLFGVHPKLRKTWSFPIKVSHAPSLPVCPYQLPPQIRYLVEPGDDGRMVA
jgi:hypothetical protein